jgi:hypothetical protein
VRPSARIALVLALASSCSPVYRAATGRCPTLATQAIDFVIAGAGLAVAADRYTAGESVVSAASFGGGMAVGLASNMSECRP